MSVLLISSENQMYVHVKKPHGLIFRPNERKNKALLKNIEARYQSLSSSLITIPEKPDRCQGFN